MKTIIHVNQHKIKSNRKTGGREPVLTVKDYKKNRLGNSAIIIDNTGLELAKVVYSPEKPLKCGAVCWIETENQVWVL